jgi:hypothetical protein
MSTLCFGGQERSASGNGVAYCRAEIVFRTFRCRIGHVRQLGE